MTAPGGPTAAAPAESRVRERCNLTNGQLVIWMGQHFAPDLACYEGAISVLIDGPVDPMLFGAAFQAVIDGSDALRTVVEETDGVPMQRVRPELLYEQPVIDLSGEPDPDAALREWTRATIAQPPRLHERTFHAALLRLGAARWAWYLGVHHLMHDGRSIQLVYERTAELYESALHGSLDAALPGVPRNGPSSLSFSDYLAVEATARDSAEWVEVDKYWRDVLEHSDEPLELYGVSSSKRTREERWVTVDLGADRTRALRDLARRPGFRSLNIDLSMLGIFATAVFTYLYKASGTRSLSLAMPFNNRSRETRDTIGMLEQVYPLRMDIEPGDTFATVMSRSMRGLLDTFAHAPHGSGNYTHRAANDVMLNYLPRAVPPLAGMPTRTEFVPRTAADGGRCLLVQVHDLNAQGSLTADLVFNVGVFPDEAQRQAATAHFLNVLDQLLADPSTPLEAVDVMTPAERHRVLVELNDTATDWPSTQTIDRLVAAQAARTPQATAAEWGQQSLSYAELDDRANRLAHHLQSLGAGRGALVGVYAERSLDLLVSVLAIFKSGAGYLPLDITYPAERLGFILEDSRASILLTQRDMPPLPGGTASAVVHLDDIEALIASQPATPPSHATTAEDLAYVIYTSGSTGRPKGAAMPQRALVNAIWWQATEASALDRPRALQFCPLSFDVSTQEIFATWCMGGTVVLPTTEVRRDPEALLRLLVSAEIEQLYAIYTPLQNLAEAVDRLGIVPHALREVFSAGEQVVITPTIERFFTRLPNCRFQNQYGSSEDLIVTGYPLPERVADWPHLPPIGRPIANTRIYLLDEALRPVPPGVPGEICVAGAQVALGYLHRPELSAERYVPDPFSTEPGALLFRQGDRARLLPSGDLQILGRLDNQVKLRGFRVEPGEVEAALTDHPLVDDAVVVLREDEPGHKKLVAYLVTAPGWTTQSLPDLHRSLAGRLAPYLVPAAFVTLDRFPKTPSGKLDRLALPAPDLDRPELETAYAAPRDGLERELATIWQQALGIERIGRHDDFFGLGGDSLLALRVIQQTEDLVDRRLPLVALFGAPTIEQLATLLKDTGVASTRRSLVPIRASGSKAPLFFVSDQSGHDLAAHLDPDRPFYGLHPRGFTGQDPDTRVEDMAANYLSEIRSIQPHGPYLLGGACLGGQVAFEMSRQLVAEGEVVAKTVIIESYAPGIIGFNPGNWRNRLSRRGKRMMAALEASPVGARLIAAGSEIRYGQRVHAKPMLEAQLVSTIKRVQRSNIRALMTYRPPPYPGAIEVFRGQRDREDIPNLGWDRYAQGGVEVHEIAGYHQTVLREPYVSTLGSKLDACLDSSGL